jgi:hypothetical protein
LNAKILALAGTFSAGLVMVGGALTPSCPRLGPALVSGAGGVMLLGNLVVLVRKDPA